MSALHHILIAACYTIAAAGVAAVLPHHLSWLDATAGAVIGGVVLIGSALLHEVFLRQEGESRLGDEMDAIRASLDAAHGEIASLRAALADAHDARATRDADGRKEVDSVIAEVKVLQGLIEQLSTARGGAAATRAAGGGVSPRRAESPLADGDGTDAAEPGGSAARSGQTDPVRNLSLVARDGEAVARPVGSPQIARGLDDEAIISIVRSGLEQNRVDLVLQPVVRLPQRRRQFYEAFTRIRDADGRILTPEQYIAIAEREGLVAAIDNMLLFRCVQLVRRSQSRNHNVGFFCNISAHSLTDRHFFANFVEFMADNTQLAPNLIFEFPYATIANRDLDIERHLNHLAQLGFRFSVDQVAGLDIDYADLMRLRFKYVKMDAVNLLAEQRAPRSQIAIDDVKRIADRHGIDLIVEKIESEKMLLELLDLRIDYGQGYLFGEPRLARIE
jgi:cyclic-di-GMP phosphodiesterase, flagellum assembly factor TipF